MSPLCMLLRIGLILRPTAALLGQKAICGSYNTKYNDDDVSLLRLQVKLVHGTELLSPFGRVMSAVKSYVQDLRSASVELHRAPSLDGTGTNYSLDPDCGQAASADAQLTSLLQQHRQPGIPTSTPWCELMSIFMSLFGNVSLGCTSERYNRDHIAYAKSLLRWSSNPRIARVDGQYCRMNGFLQAEAARLRNNFSALEARGKEYCRSEPILSHNWKRMSMLGILKTFTFDELEMALASLTDHEMTQELAEATAAFSCALGSLPCDMAYCSFTYCDRGDKTVGAHHECEGFDGIHGVPVP
eukprot:gnl/TRDRNA2_/TRDRNA2_157400_c0_seq1.p1 gnl/TRDRNA2_/TRDRNA2_157400_c0~~gnl/TRDRNA2_/TRDRNA2_157400_c0_seq1.p1  ORF type:complete len:300 (+),score=26.62 gnl/TRDRNA2_/TRDRNA2_157400_c0_seq1:30-929(+)